MPDEKSQGSFTIREEDPLLICTYSGEWGRREILEYISSVKAKLDASDRKLYQLIIVETVPKDMTLLGVTWENKDSLVELLHHKNAHHHFFIMADTMMYIVAENIIKILGIEESVQLVIVNSIEEAKVKAAELAKLND